MDFTLRLTPDLGHRCLCGAIALPTAPFLMTLSRNKTNLLGDPVGSVFHITWKSSHFLPICCYDSLVQPPSLMGLLQWCGDRSLSGVLVVSSQHTSHNEPLQMSVTHCTPQQKSPVSSFLSKPRPWFSQWPPKAPWFTHSCPPPISLLILYCPRIAPPPPLTSFIIWLLFSASFLLESQFREGRDFCLGYSQIPAQSPEFSIYTKNDFQSKGFPPTAWTETSLWTSKRGEGNKTPT